jgi:hypothetical protein
MHRQLGPFSGPIHHCANGFRVIRTGQTAKPISRRRRFESCRGHPSSADELRQTLFVLEKQCDLISQVIEYLTGVGVISDTS